VFWSPSKTPHNTHTAIGPTHSHPPQIADHPALVKAYATSKEAGDTLLTKWIQDDTKLALLSFDIIDGAHRW
jgi:hypothetical protein